MGLYGTLSKYRVFQIKPIGAYAGFLLVGQNPPTPLVGIPIPRQGDANLWAAELRSMIPDIDTGAYANDTLWIMVDDSGSMSLSTVQAQLNIFKAMFVGKIKMDIQPKSDERWLKWVTDAFG